MDDWKIYRIKDIGRVITGKTPPSSKQEYFGYEIPFLTPTDMDESRIVEKPLRFLSDEGKKAFSRLLIPYGVGVSCIGWQMGKSILINTPSVTNQQLNTIIPNNECIDTLFLYYVMKSRRNELFKLGSGGSRTPILNKTDFENLFITLPPLYEQKEIATVLGALDDKIELNRQMNETLEAMAQALFKSWFVDFDPVKANAEGRTISGLVPTLQALFPTSFEPSALGEIPARWRTRPLDDIADFLNGLACQKYPPEDESNYLPVIKIAELRQGITEGSDKVSMDIDSKYIIKDGDVLFSWSGSLLVCIWCKGKGALNQHLFKVTSGEFPKWFYYLWVKHHLPEFQAIAADKATTMGHIKRHHLTDSLTVCPNPELFETMNMIMEPLLERVIHNELESRTLAQLRDTLLPKLLGGEIQVADVEAKVEAFV